MHQYSYDGPVMMFDTCVADRWKGTTYAASERKARANLSYQYKKRNKRVAGSRVTLPGKIVMIEQEGE